MVPLSRGPETVPLTTGTSLTVPLKLGAWIAGGKAARWRSMVKAGSSVKGDDGHRLLRGGSGLELRVCALWVCCWSEALDML